MRTLLACGLLALLPSISRGEPPRPAPSSALKPSPAPARSAPAVVLEGAVRGPDGKPVEGALVIARAQAAVSQDVPATARTDANGHFQLPAKAGSLYAVRVEARGLASRTLEKVRPGAALNVALEKGGFIQGTVRDGNTGQPVAGARVEVSDEWAGPLVLPWEADAGRTRVAADARGRFRLEGLAAGLHTLSATSHGSGRARKPAVPLGATVDLYLFTGPAVRGVVRGPDDRPVAGAVVRVESPLPMRPIAPPPETTDAEGRYEIAGIRSGTYRVLAYKKGFAPAAIPDVAVGQGEVEVDLMLETGARVRGRLVGDSGEPVRGRVLLREMKGEASRAIGDLLRAEAGDDGRFAIDSVPAGSHALSVTAAGYAAKRVEVEVSRRDTAVDLGDVALETGLAIRGRVRDKAGSPIADAVVRGLQPRAMGPSTLFPEASTDPAGEFVLAGLSPGNWRLTATAPGFGSAVKQVPAGAEAADFVLIPAGSITGLAVDDADRPIAAFQVMARPASQDTPSIVMAPRFKSVANAEGRFVLEDVGEGAYVLLVTAPDRATALVSDVTVTPGALVDVGRVRVSAGGTVRGTVVDASGGPVAGASVSVRGPGRDFMMMAEAPQALTDPSGAFELRGVAVGAGEAVATHPSYAEGRTGVEVDPAKGPTEARIVLTQGGRVEGLVRRRDGTGIAGVLVRVTAGGPGGFGPSDPGIQTTGADGSFAAEHLPAGHAMVVLLNRTGSTFTSSQMKDVEVREGQTTAVEFRSHEILLTGRVTRGGSPYPGVRLTMQGDRMMFMSYALGGGSDAPPAGPQHMAATTREDGGYEMLVDEPGKLRLAAETLDRRLRYPSRPVDIPDADTFALDLDYSGALVAGIVVDAETEQPISGANVFASPKKRQAGPGGSSSETGADGRFQLELEPGDYRVQTSMQGYAPAGTEVSVGGDGAPEVRLALTRALAIAGKVVDARGAGVGGLNVFATANDPQGAGGSALTLPDGSFEISGLSGGSYSVLTRSELGSFGFLSRVSAGAKDVALALRPGGKLRIQVLGPDGQPVDGAMARVSRVAGVRVASYGFDRSDGQGMVELTAPAAEIEVEATKDQLNARAPASVVEGVTVPLELRLKAGPAKPGEDKRDERRVIGPGGPGV